MTLLTDKALKDFNQWLFDKYNLNTGLISGMPETCQLALIVEWLDTFEYRIDVQCEPMGKFKWTIHTISGYFSQNGLNSRNEALKQSIECFNNEIKM